MGGSLTFQSVDLTNKVAIVTGGNAGIGYETTKALAVMGAHTIIACRSEERATGAIEQMRQEVSQSHPDKTINVEFMKLDLSSFKSTKDFTVAFKDKHLPLHILVNNAGLFHVPFMITEDGNELHNQVNHLGHFLLTLELLPLLLDTASSTGDCRIVILASSGHYSGQFDVSNMNGEVSYSRVGFYQHSKLYTVMFGFSLQRRLCNVGITVSSSHPGYVRTENAGNVIANSDKLTWKIGYHFIKHLMRNPDQGAVTPINCAVNPQLNSQQHFYFDNCTVKQPSNLSMNAELQEQLWEVNIQKVKDWLSPEVLEKYGRRQDIIDQQSARDNTPASSTVPQPHADS